MTIKTKTAKANKINVIKISSLSAFLLLWFLEETVVGRAPKKKLEKSMN